jgi:hypothetical protein
LSQELGRDHFSGMAYLGQEVGKSAVDQPTRKEPAMNPTSHVSPQAFAQAMRQETEQLLQQVMAAVNAAPDGAWINASEMQVRDLLGEYRRRVFEKALQMRAQVAEGAFSPDRGQTEEQGP